jgi:hypothetical protein
VRAIINLTNQLLLCTLNSGRTVYLGPAERSRPIDPIELAGNDKVEKLIAARLAMVVALGASGEIQAPATAEASDPVVPAPHGVAERQEVPVEAAAPARPKASLARFQFLVFTVVFAGLFVLFSIKAGTFVDVPAKVLGLFGVSAGSLLVSQALK